MYLLEEYRMGIFCVHEIQGSVLFKSISNKACQIASQNAVQAAHILTLVRTFDRTRL